MQDTDKVDLETGMEERQLSYLCFCGFKIIYQVYNTNLERWFFFFFKALIYSTAKKLIAGTY